MIESCSNTALLNQRELAETRLPERSSDRLLEAEALSAAQHFFDNTESCLETLNRVLSNRDFNILTDSLATLAHEDFNNDIVIESLYRAWISWQLHNQGHDGDDVEHALGLCPKSISEYTSNVNSKD